MIDTLYFLWIAYRAYRKAQAHGTNYSAIISHGVPQVCLFIGVGREAWRISQRAIEEMKIEVQNPFGGD